MGLMDEIRKLTHSKADDEEYYDEYDDDDAPGAGHYILGFIKFIIAVALILVVAVFGMYFADQAIDGGFKPYRMLAEKVPFISEYLPASEVVEIEDPAIEDGETVDEITEDGGETTEDGSVG